jgi:hypothetical protein
MDDRATQTMHFETRTALALEASFDGRRVASDGGLVWPSEMDTRVGLCAASSECVPQWRKWKGRHPLASLVRKRVY